jgi:hypothetical protein
MITFQEITNEKIYYSTIPASGVKPWYRMVPDRKHRESPRPVERQRERGECGQKIFLSFTGRNRWDTVCKLGFGWLE